MRKHTPSTGYALKPITSTTMQASLSSRNHCGAALTLGRSFLSVECCFGGHDDFHCFVTTCIKCLSTFGNRATIRHKTTILDGHKFATVNLTLQLPDFSKFRKLPCPM